MKSNIFLKTVNSNYTSDLELKNLHSNNDVKELSKSITNSEGITTIITNCYGKITFWSKSAETLFGWKEKEIIGRSIIKVLFPNTFSFLGNCQKTITNINKVMLEKQSEIKTIRKGGEKFVAEISVIAAEQNETKHYYYIIKEVSVKKEVEKNIKKNEQKYYNIITNMNFGLIEIDRKGFIQYINKAFCTSSGFKREEIIGKNIFELFNGEKSTIQLMKKQLELREKGISSVYELPFRNKKGELRWWIISGAPNYDSQGNYIGGIGMYFDNTEKKRLEESLKNEIIKTKKASKAKEVFIANMSHEIRTPLNAIIGFLNELKRQNIKSIQDELIEHSSNASQHLLSVINNILDISKIEAGEMSLDNKNFSLKECILNVISVFKDIANKKKIKLTAALDTALAETLKGDDLKIKQILYNIIGNSLKFTEKGEVNIQCQVLKNFADYQTIQIQIKDTGQGISKSFVKNIFNRFNQENNNFNKCVGTGLGMSITKDLIELMNGTIKIESQKNIGTTITLNLTLIKAKEIFEKEKVKELKNISIKGVNVLLVEDDELSRLVARNSLNYFECNVMEAQNGKEALEVIRKKKFDIILMDIQMPELNGIETTKILRRNNINTPIIALTAGAFTNEIESYLSAGMNDYIIKPFEEKKLQEIIYEYIFLHQQKILDKARLYNIDKNLSKNINFLQKIISIFIIQTRKALVEIENALKTENYLEISRLAHKIYPSIDSIGVFSILEDVKQMEILAKKQGCNRNDIQPLFLKIKKVLNQVIAKLKEERI